MKFSSRGMIRIKMPAISATIAGTCAAVMCIEMAPGFRGESNRGRQFTRADPMRQRRFQIETFVAPTGSALHENCPKLPRMRRRFLRNTAPRDELGSHCARRQQPAPLPCEGVSHAKQVACRCGDCGRVRRTDDLG